MVGLFSTIRRKIQYNREKIFTGLAVYIFVLSLTAGSAWSFEQIKQVRPDNTTSTPSFSGSKSSAASKEICSSFLKSLDTHTQDVSFDTRTRRSAGKVAALGLVFGVKFALGPKEIKRSDRVRPFLGMADTSAPSRALAIADYRRCMNEQALKAASQSSIKTIENWRWMR